MEINPYDDDYEYVYIFGIECLFTNARLNRSALPDGVYSYEIRGSDDDPGELCYLERNVFVNHAGTILSMEPIPLGPLDHVDICDEIDFEGGSVTLEEYLEERR